jgi:hypothetical protein
MLRVSSSMKFVPEGCIINKGMYIEILHRFRDAVKRNASKSFMSIGESVSLPKRTTLKKILCKQM